jgi:HlyD family secretion protein
MNLRQLVRVSYDFVRPLGWSLLLCAATGVLSLIVVYIIVWPAYKNPIARMYTSKLGYSTVIRKTGGAFPIRAATVEPREIIGKFIGEGLTQSEPIQVPMVAMARIDQVNAIEGQRVRKGDVIVQLDQSKIQLKIESARAAMETAKAELERVRIGTVNVLQQERPNILALQANVTEAEAKMRKLFLSMNKDLRDSQAINAVEYAESEFAALQSQLNAEIRKLEAETAMAGRESSIVIAESAIREAELTLSHRISELDDYTSVAPQDGVVERVFVHAGEYNQDPGRPAVLLASGLWFECYLDQTAIGRVQLNDAVEVRLSAHQDHVFKGQITLIRPLVNFSLGGPETNRPIRPLGTGAPEWPSTFSVRVSLEESEHLVVPGLTGYATVIQKRNVLAVPRGTVNAVSGNRGIAFVIGSDGESFTPRNVVTGISDGRWVEIREGLQAGEKVITDGHQVLQPGDRIAIQDSNDLQPEVEGTAEYLSSRAPQSNAATELHAVTHAPTESGRQRESGEPVLSDDQLAPGKSQLVPDGSPEE